MIDSDVLFKTNVIPATSFHYNDFYINTRPYNWAPALLAFQFDIVMCGMSSNSIVPDFFSSLSVFF